MKDLIKLENCEWECKSFILFHSIKGNRAEKIEKDKKMKGKERTKCLSYQRNVDRYKKNFKKKGESLKEKGKVCKGIVPCNSRCAKSWRHLGTRFGMAPYTGNYKFSAIWAMT